MGESAREKLPEHVLTVGEAERKECVFQEPVLSPSMPVLALRPELAVRRVGLL
jgi:hypothetical protein